jgi:nucleotide-binding universal stress UspA family protein
MKKVALPRGRSSAKIVVVEKGHRAEAPAAPMAPVQLKIRHLLVPIDFSKLSEKALRYAVGIAGQFGAEITLMHVVEQVVTATDWVYPFTLADFPIARDTLTKKLGELAKDTGVKTNTVVHMGNPARQIVDTAREREVDLIVLSTHGYTGLKHALLGSVAEKVVRHAPCPVLTVRPNERDFL